MLGTGSAVLAPNIKVGRSSDQGQVGRSRRSSESVPHFTKQKQKMRGIMRLIERGESED
jgi:hypothetical protein